MFKKIEIWILYLTILLSILLAIGFGVLVRQELVGSIKAGFISKTALAMAEIPVNLKKIIKGASNELIVEDRFKSLNGFSGTPNLEKFYLLLSRYDGDLREGLVELIDLSNFEILHTWNPNIDAFNNLIEQYEEFKYLKRDASNIRAIPSAPVINNDLNLAFNTLEGPKRLIDACSNLVFQTLDGIYHHSLEIDKDGNFWSPNYIYPPLENNQKIGDKLRQEGGFYNDGIVKISPDGKKLYQQSVAQIFINNGLEYLLFSTGERRFNRDPIHLNDIQPVNFDGEYWKKGDIFLSLRHQSMVLLYRPSTGKIIWKKVGPFFHQHDVDILDDHRISIFNNNSKNLFDGDRVDGNNEVIIYNFKTDSYSYYLKNALIDQDVRTVTDGRSEILPNGQLFIEETNYGRTLLFNGDGSLRWTHVNRAGNENVYSVGWSRIIYTKNELELVDNFLKNKEKCND